MPKRTFISKLQSPVARGLALVLSLFTLLNIAGSYRIAGFDANVWWIDLAFLPKWAATLILIVAALALLLFAIGFGERRRRLLAIAIVPLLLAVMWNVIVFYRQWAAGRIHPGVPIPLSLILLLSLMCVLRSMLKPAKLSSPKHRLAFAAAFVASLFVFPLSQMYCFGMTDYRRPADAIVVFGARTYADGSLSPALSDRTFTAIKLYQQHLAPVLIFSGGPGDGAISEPQAMRNLAISHGVPASAIILDELGLNTEMTVNNTVPIFKQRQMKKVLAVSHFYHLPRVKMAYARALDGSQIEVLTVPAEESAPLPRMPFYMAREIAALWMYYLRPLF